MLAFKSFLKGRSTLVFAFLSYEQLSSRCLATVDIVVIDVLMWLVEIDVMLSLVLSVARLFCCW